MNISRQSRLTKFDKNLANKHYRTQDTAILEPANSELINEHLIKYILTALHSMFNRIQN